MTARLDARLRTFHREGLAFDVLDDGPVDGDVVILLHGFPGNASTWSAVIPPLVAAGHRTLAPDQRGYCAGALAHDVAAYRIDELVADVLALADHAGAGRFDVIGHDWGGVVAWHLAAAHAERVGTLTVLSTPHPRAMASAMTRSLQPLRSSYALAWQLPVVTEQVMLAADGALMRAMLRRSGLDAARADDYVGRMGQPGLLTGALNWYRAAARAPRRTSAAGTIDVPTTYLWSTGDVALGRTAATLTARYVRAPYRFVVLDGVSHWIPETEPHAVATAFLDSRIAVDSAWTAAGGGRGSGGR